MPRKGDYGAGGDADCRVQGTFLSAHAFSRAKERGVRLDDLRRHTRHAPSGTRAARSVVDGVTSVVASNGKIITTYRARERRIDPADGKQYTEVEFRAYYPSDGHTRWAAAAVYRTWSAPLPAKLVGRFIGKGGAHIRTFNERYDVHATVVKDTTDHSSQITDHSLQTAEVGAAAGPMYTLKLTRHPLGRAGRAPPCAFGDAVQAVKAFL